MIFPLMTDEQMKAADEETLRLRVRELQSATKVWQDIKIIQEQQTRILHVICDRLQRLEPIIYALHDIRMELRRLRPPPPHVEPTLYDKVSVNELEITARIAHCLDNAGIKTIGQLLRRTEADMLREPNFGRISLRELRDVLAERGLQLAPKVY